MGKNLGDFPVRIAGRYHGEESSAPGGCAAEDEEDGIGEDTIVDEVTR